MVNMSDSSLVNIHKAYSELQPQILTDFTQKILVGFGESTMAQNRKSFQCDQCGNDRSFIGKTRHGKETKILMVFQWIKLKQLQVQCKKCGHKINRLFR